jgi:hypothetical protein
LTPFLAPPSRAGEAKALTPAEQDAFLAKRTKPGIIGTFDSYCSLLYAVSEVAIHTESDEVNKTSLSSPFPDFYEPTWRELFETIARQTKSSWKYDRERNFWVFGNPPQAQTYTLTLAEGWKAHDEGFYVGYRPKTAPVGMDVYLMGRYSAPAPAEASELFKKVREATAIEFAKHFKEDVTVKDMQEVPVGELKALHFQAKAPTGIVWRQWVVVESGLAFAIVSAIKPEDEKDILPDVRKMVESFKIAEKPESAPKDAPKDPAKPANGKGK